MFVIVCKQSLHAQDDKESHFLERFHQLSYAKKVIAFDSLNENLKLKYFPEVKAELETIKQKAISDNKQDILSKLQKIDAELFYLNKNYTKSILLLTDLLAQRRVFNFRDSISVLYLLKNSYVKVQSLHKAIEIHKVMEVLKKQHPGVSEWMYHPKLSVIYYNMKLFKQCLNQQLQEYKEIQHDKNMVLGYHNNRGLFWMKEGNYDSALASYDYARKLFFEIYDKNNLTPNDKALLGLLNGNTGVVYIQLKKYDKAIPLIKNDLEASLAIKDYQNTTSTRISLAECFIATNQLPLAKAQLDSAERILKNNDDVSSKLQLFKQYASYYSKVGEPSSSIQYYNHYINFKDSIDKSENNKQLIAAQVTSQMAEKEKQISENIRNLNEKKVEVSRQKTIRNAILFCGIVLLFTSIFVIIQLQKLKARNALLNIKNKRIETRNEIINKALNEKDLLIKEVHHRVKNNLQIISSLLKLQAAKSINTEIKTALTEAEERINSMALLHQLLYRKNDMTTLNLKDYLSGLLQQVSLGFASSSKHIMIKTNLIELDVDLDTAIPLGLITNELLSNVYKHAFTNKSNGEIKVELTKTLKNTYCLKISDNGMGLPNNIEVERSDSLGLEIVSILSEQINADLKMYNQNGAHFEIIFKVS